MIVPLHRAIMVQNALTMWLASLAGAPPRTRAPCASPVTTVVFVQLCVDSMSHCGCLCLVLVELDECLSNPCQNKATCVDMFDAFKCYCLAGFEGVFCQAGIFL